MMFVRTSMDSESQDATIITSALADPLIYSSMKMMTLDMHMNAVTIFLCVSPSFSSSVLTMLTSRLTGVCMTNNSYQQSVLEDNDCPFLEDFHCKEERQYDSDFESEDDEWLGTENQWCSLLNSSYHYSIGSVLLGCMEELDSASISATCQFAIFIAPVERETATKHVCGYRIYRLWC